MPVPDPVPRPGEGGRLRSGELALRAARAPARVPSLEGWEELSGEWMRRPDGSCGTAPYWESSCVLRFWYLKAVEESQKGSAQRGHVKSSWDMVIETMGRAACRGMTRQDEAWYAQLGLDME